MRFIERINTVGLVLVGVYLLMYYVAYSDGKGEEFGGHAYAMLFPALVLTESLGGILPVRLFELLGTVPALLAQNALIIYLTAHLVPKTFRAMQGYLHGGA